MKPISSIRHFSETRRITGTSVCLLVFLFLTSGCSIRYGRTILKDDVLNRKVDPSIHVLPVVADFTLRDKPVPGGSVSISFGLSAERLRNYAFVNIADYEEVIARKNYTDILKVETASYGPSVRYLVGKQDWFRPYVGLGLDRSRLRARMKDPKYNPRTQWCTGACSAGVGDLYLHKGFGARVLAGVQIKIVLIEYERIFDKGNELYPLDRNRFTVGLRVYGPWGR